MIVCSGREFVISDHYSALFVLNVHNKTLNGLGAAPLLLLLVNVMGSLITGWMLCQPAPTHCTPLSLSALFSVPGGHVNPAVSLAMVVLGKLKIWKFPFYVIAQFLGAFAGAAAVFGLYYGELSFTFCSL